ncbi:MAG TPA: prepilin-type N-terminal cleavage/methylation domain-containing protein, partial [Desulfuromonadaceae bacterium]|nr:prepilin-type N-terminal cleavage/methylation domain-containing protein [Desulfuromonadaceae bacterium]
MLFLLEYCEIAMALPLLSFDLMGTGNRHRAFTLTELLTSITIIGILAALLLPALAAAKRKSSRINCVYEVKQGVLAFKIWANDHGDQYPMSVAVEKGGAKEFAERGIASRVFQVMSNEINAPAVLHCPNDTNTLVATTFAKLSNRNISYFIGVDATEENLQTILLGDDNLVVNGRSVWPGLWELPVNVKLEWSAGRH